MDDATAPQPMLLLTDVTLPSDTVISLDSPDPDGEARKITQALTNWPFGGSDDDTIRTAAQTALDRRPEPVEAVSVDARGAENADAAGAAEAAERRQRIEAQHATLAETANELAIPNQRSAVFNPLQVAPKPPPNPYLAAERRQQANFRSQV